MNKIKVVWLCALSNAEVRKHYTTKLPFLMRLVYNMMDKSKLKNSDYGNWNTFGIHEFEKFENIELHVINPVRYLTEKEVRFEINGVRYYFFREQNSSFIKQLRYQLYGIYKSEFTENRKYIAKVISEINPDIVHVIGAENPQYSMSIFDIPKTIPTIIQLQTLLSKRNVESNIKLSKSLQYKGKIEKRIFSTVDFIGCDSKAFATFIKNKMNLSPVFFNIGLAAIEPINIEYDRKETDFVYFAVDISKTFEHALATFALAFKRDNSLTLNVIGGFSDVFKKKIDERIKELGLENAISFKGRLETHEDVIKEIKRSRYALIPLKFAISGTVREAMACGLPVITNKVNGSEFLNKQRESVLLSEVGDFNDMARNMLRLATEPNLSDDLKRNALLTINEYESNEHSMKRWSEAYKACIEFKKNGTPISKEILLDID